MTEINKKLDLAMVPPTNNDGDPYILPLDIYKEGYSGYNISNWFKGRVGDNGTPFAIRWYSHGRLLNIQGMRPFIEGQVGDYTIDDSDPDNIRIDMAEDASNIHIVGDVDDTQAGGVAIYRLINQAFPKSGIFYGKIGFMGTQDDGTLVNTGVDIVFKVLAGNMNMLGARKFYVSELEKAWLDLQEKIRQYDQQYKDQTQQQADQFKQDTENALADLNTKIANEIKRAEDTLGTTQAAIDANLASLKKIAVSVGAVQAQIDAGNVVTLKKHQDDYLALENEQKNLSTAIDDRLAKITYQPEEFINEDAIKAKYPTGNDGKGIAIAADTGHKWLYVDGSWKDCGVYQAEGPNPELVDLRTDYYGDKYKTAGEAIRNDFGLITKKAQSNLLAHRVVSNTDAMEFTNVVKTGDTLFVGAPLFDDVSPKIGSKFTGKTNGEKYWFTLAVPVKSYDILQASFAYPDNPNAFSIFYLDQNNQIVRIEHLDKSDSNENDDSFGQARYIVNNYSIFCDYNVATVLIASIDSRPDASIRVLSTTTDVPIKGHWINATDTGDGGLYMTDINYRVTTDMPISYDYDVTAIASENTCFFVNYYDDPSGISASTKSFSERTRIQIPAGQYFRLTICHADGSTSPLDIDKAINALHIRVDTRFSLANQRETLAQAELADRQENIYALVAQDAHDAGKHFHMEKIVDNDEAAKKDQDSFQSVYLDDDVLHMLGYHNGKAVDRTWQDGKMTQETVKPDTGHDGDVTKIGNTFYIIGSSVKDGKVEGNVIYKWNLEKNTREIIDIASKLGTPTDSTHVRAVTGIDRLEGSDTQLIIATTDGLPDLGKSSKLSKSDKLIFWKYDIPSGELSEIKELRWTETFVQGITCLDGITYIATNPIVRNPSNYAGIKIIGYDSGTFRKIKEIYIKGVFEAEGLSHVVENGVPKLVFGLCHYADLMRVYKLTL